MKTIIPCDTLHSGELLAWGYNGFGELGLGDTTHRHSPVQVGALNTWHSVACGSYHSLACTTMVGNEIVD